MQMVKVLQRMDERFIMGGVLLMAIMVLPVKSQDNMAQTGGMMKHAHSPIAVSVTFDKTGKLWKAAVENGEFVIINSSTDLGKNFSLPVRVNPTPEKILADGENRPKVVVADNGDLYVSYTQGLDQPYSANIRFSRSLDHGKTFSSPLTINDNHEIISHRFEAMKFDRHGNIHIAWLDRRDKKAADAKQQSYPGDALYYAVSKDRGASFSVNQKLAEHTCECCRVSMAIDKTDIPVLFWRHIFPDNIRDHALLRLDKTSEVHHVSEDHWNIDACPHHGGALSIDERGDYHVVWYSGGGKRQGLFYANSRDHGRTFSVPLPFGNNDQQAGHADVLSVGKRLYLTWKGFDGENSVIYAQQSRDSGKHWEQPVLLAKSVAASDHPQLVQHHGDAMLSWNTLDKGWQLIPLRR